MTKYELTSFYAWLHNDNVIKREGGYSTQCSQYANRLTYKELKQYFKKEYLS